MRIYNVGIFFKKDTNCMEALHKVKKIINNHFKIFNTTNYDVKIYPDWEDNCIKLQTDITIYEIWFVDENWQMRAKKYTQVYYDPSFSKEFVDFALYITCIGVKGDEGHKLDKYFVSLDDVEIKYERGKRRELKPIDDSCQLNDEDIKCGLEYGYTTYYGLEHGCKDTKKVTNTELCFKCKEYGKQKSDEFFKILDTSN